MGNFSLKETDWFFTEQDNIYRMLTNEKNPFKLNRIRNYLRSLEQLEEIEEYCTQIQSLVAIFQRNHYTLLDKVKTVWSEMEKEKQQTIVVKLIEYQRRLDSNLDWIFPNILRERLKSISEHLQSFTIHHCHHQLQRDLSTFSIDNVPRDCLYCDYYRQC